MSYPSPDQWRDYAAQARWMAGLYRRDAVTAEEPLRSQWLARAEDCDDRADWYDDRAYQEEWRLAHQTPRREAA